MVYDFQMGRAREGPANFLEGFEGRLQSDGYAAYGKIGGPGLLHFGCWAHVRRKFFEASKLDSRDKRSVAVLAGIGKLYAVEKVLAGENRFWFKGSAMRGVTPVMPAVVRK